MLKSEPLSKTPARRSTNLCHRQTVSDASGPFFACPPHQNKAILQHYLHGALEPIRHGIADTMTQARQEMGEHTRAQMAYVDDRMLRDREKFVTEQKAALQALDTSLRKRDAGIVKIMADILEKARATFAEEMKKAVKEHTNQGAYNPDQRPKKAKNWAALRAGALGIAVGSMGTMATIIILLRLGIVGVVGAGQ